MPTILTHPAVPLAVGIGLGTKRIPAPLLAAGVAASILPDLDVLAFRLGIPYANGFGHRGFSHSLLFAALIALIGAVALRKAHITFAVSLWFLFFAIASHGILDAFTTGGMGIAFLWPFSGTRYFAPIQFIRVAPLSLARFLSLRGLIVLKSEFLCVWLPAAGFTAIALLMRHYRAANFSDEKA